MTEVEQPPQNGIDLSAEDDDNNKARPADIEQVKYKFNVPIVRVTANHQQQQLNRFFLT